MLQYCHLFPFYAAIFLFSCFSMQGPYTHGLAASVGRGNGTDHQALLEFKAKITGDYFGVMPFWNNTLHFCGWYGVTCSRRRQRVTKLELPSLKLTGALSPFVGNLSFLRVLDLQNNSFSHAIPSEIGHLHRLLDLRLNNNSFGGELPSNISSCSKLEILRLHANLLEGEIPSVLGRLSHLKELALPWNKFTGSIPPSFGNLSALEYISLAVNRLSGHIPETLGQLKNLIFLSLTDNRISGITPASIFNQSSIRVLAIGLNQLQGNLPSDLGITMPNVEMLSISSNEITGSFPISITNASNLSQLQFLLNKLSGNLPSLEKLSKLNWFSIDANHLGIGGENDLSFLCSLINATSLKILTIGYNNFGGPLPECISNLSTTLVEFNIEHNKISGRIPAGIEKFIGLEVLGVSGNLLSSYIPHGIGRLQKLKIFYTNTNLLSGTIPTSFGNLTMLIALALNKNNLRGSIPPELGRCENLAILDLSDNYFTGSIPPEVMGLSSLSIILALSSNNLTGKLPVEVENLKNLGVLDVSSNMLSGILPNSIGSCVMMEKLYLDGNFFQGPIPSSLSSLRGLEILDISRNNMSGKIPDFLEKFGALLYLNLSFNDLEGALPTEGVFKNESATFIQGNRKLCGGNPVFHLPRCNFKNNRSTNSLKKKVSIVFAILGVTLVFSFLLLLCFRKKKEQPIAATCVGDSRLKLSYQSVLKATNGFSSEYLIGSGSFGSVYKGILEESGVAIAVKVFNLLSRGASRSFMAECEALKNIRHRNLVKILTAISGVDYQGNDFKALVYEFMQNGSLEDWLHQSVGTEQGTMKRLTLVQRVNVAAHVASALEYLHHHSETPIIHCDLKPSNILLDEEMVGHIGDFGLAKILKAEMPNHSTSQSSPFGLRGTIGYAPPEYGLGSEVSTKGDVYSYGILLLQMFTGKRPTDKLFEEGHSLRNFVRAGLAEGLMDEIIDPILLVEERLGRHFQHLTSIFEIGVICSSESPAERMDMSVVAAKLCSIRDKLFHPTQVHR